MDRDDWSKFICNLTLFYELGYRFYGDFEGVLIYYFPRVQVEGLSSIVLVTYLIL